MKIVAMAARKGGSGKSTLTAHLAVAAIQDGLRVAIVDLDPQATVAEWADEPGDDPPDVVSRKPARLVPAKAVSRLPSAPTMRMTSAPTSTPSTIA